MNDRPHLLVGPISYKQTIGGNFPHRMITVCKWEFIGFTSKLKVRRWHLCFSVENRKFYANTLTVSAWEQAHAAELHARFMPLAILRSDLPKGSMTVALKAMIPETDVAEVVAISLRGGEFDSDNP